MSFEVVPLPQEFLDRVRTQGIDDQGQPVERFISAEGGEPCRDVLRRARPGEKVILASYCPFSVPGPFREYGPVYVLASPASEATRRDLMPLPDGTPEAYFGAQLALRRYNRQERLCDGVVVSAEEALETLGAFLAQEDTAFVQARFAGFGCFAARIEREG